MCARRVIVCRAARLHWLQPAHHQRCHRSDDTQEALLCFIVRAGARDARPRPKKSNRHAPSLVYSLCSALAPADSELSPRGGCARTNMRMSVSVLSTTSLAYAINAAFSPKHAPMDWASSQPASRGIFRDTVCKQKCLVSAHARYTSHRTAITTYLQCGLPKGRTGDEVCAAVINKMSGGTWWHRICLQTCRHGVARHVNRF